MSARRCALESLDAWEETSRFAGDILADLATRHRLSSADRGLAQEILYGVIRNLYLLDELVARLRDGRVQPSTRNLLRIGLYQLLLSEIADHAAVNETVEIARKREKGLVNAVLRNALRRRDELLAEIETWPPEDRFSHPDFLIERWAEQYGEETALELCRWNNRPPVTYARLNPLATDREALDRVESATQPCWVGEQAPGFFAVEGAPDPEWIEKGLIYVQDPATALACRLLDPAPGETVLDACAAPGGKTALLAALMENRGSIVATDSSATRLEQLSGNLDRLGVAIADVRRLDWDRANPDEFDALPRFDAVLLDVPCSNTGVMRRRIDVRWRLQPDDFRRHAELQSRLLAAASRVLKPGGRLVYSTCSIDREENEDVIAASGMRQEKVERSLPWENGCDGAFAALLRP